MTLKIDLKRKLSFYVKKIIRDSLNLKWGFKAFHKVTNGRFPWKMTVCFPTKPKLFEVNALGQHQNIRFLSSRFRCKNSS